MAKYAILNTFYASDLWRNFRMALILERGPRCQCCGRTVAKTIELIGHHKIELTPENVHDHSISLDPDLVELICADCHNMEHRRFGYQHLKEVYLVYGPPLSGKSTLLRQRAKRGDIIVDIDRLYGAMSGLPYYDKPDALFSNVIAVQNLLLDQIRTRLGKWANAWVVGGYADKFKRERLADDLGAELVFCNASHEECLRRLDADENLRYRKDEWHKYIDKWFDQYRE